MKAQSNKYNWRTTLTRSLIGGGVLFVMLLIYLLHDLPSVDEITVTYRNPNIAIYTKEGDLISSNDGWFGDVVDAHYLPAHVYESHVAIEDHRFFSHWGVDVSGTARALWTNLRGRRVQQGGSTISQQLSKSLLVSLGRFKYYERSIKRKLQELIFTLWLEYSFDKKDILSIYLNRVYYGSGCYGIDSAAKKYFGKHAQDLNLPEAAMLAGLLKAPSRLSPLSHLDKSKERAALVLDKMLERGFLKHVPHAEARAALEDYVLPISSRQRQYIADLVYERLPADLLTNREDLDIISTLDMPLQLHMEKVAEETFKEYGDTKNVTQMAAIAMNTKGEILGLIGGKSYSESQFNRVTQSARQVGSVFKFFVYLAALEKGFEGDEVFDDKLAHYGDWAPKNYNNRFYGELTVKQAFARSNNIIAVKVAQQIGVEAIAEMCERLGINTYVEPHLASVLGTNNMNVLEVARAFAVVANGGRYIEPQPLYQIRDKETKKKLYQPQQHFFEQVLEPDDAKKMEEFLAEVMESGSGRRNAKLNIPCFGKSGTSQAHRDAWFVGYANNVILAVWLGNDDFSPMKKVTGGGLPAKIWHKMMQPIEEKYYKDMLKNSTPSAPKERRSRPTNPIPLIDFDQADEEAA